MASLTIDEFVEALRALGADEDCFVRETGTLQLPRRSSAKLADLLGRARGLNEVRSLSVSAERYDPAWEACFPSLQTLHLHVDPLKTPTLTVQHERLEKLEISLKKRPKPSAITLSGRLPSLVRFTLRREKGEAFVTTESLAALLATAPALETVSLYLEGAWPSLVSLARKLEHTSKLTWAMHPNQWADGNFWFLDRSDVAPHEEARERDWKLLLEAQSLGCSFDSWTYWWLVDRAERFAQVEHELRACTKELHLVGALHRFLLEDPTLLRDFSQVETLELHNAEDVTSEGLLWLSANLPKLTRLRIINLHAARCSCLALSSASLQSLYVLHHHALKTYEFNAPSLTELQFVQCDNSSIEPLDQAERSCDGNVGERLLRDLLENAPHVQLPSLRSFAIGHDQVYGGPALVYEELRVDVPCTAGHPRLEELAMSRCRHLRSVTLRHLPALREVFIDEGELEDDNPGWLEVIDTSDLDPDCKLTIPEPAPSRKAPSLPG